MFSFNVDIFFDEWNVEDITLFLAESVFCISTGCWVMLEKGTSMENLMVWSSWMTMLETILKLGFLFPPPGRW